MLIYESIYKYVTHIFDWRYILYYITISVTIL